MPKPTKIALTFALGANNVAPDEELPKGSAREVVNLDITAAGKLRTRQGSRLVLDLPRSHSLWSVHPWAEMYCVADRHLLRITPALDTHDLATLTTDAQLFYAEWAEAIYYSNGVDYGLIRNGEREPWGVEEPTSAPVLSGAGEYYGVVTFVSSSGEESAPSPLSRQGGTSFSSIPQPRSQDIQAIRLYLSLEARTDKGTGVVFYLAEQVPVGTASSLTQGPVGPVLYSSGMRRVKPGTHLIAWRGRLYWAEGNTVRFSEPYPHLGLTTPHTNFFKPKDSPITLLAGVTDGIYFADEVATWFREPSGAERKAHPYGAMSPHRDIPAEAFAQNAVPAPFYPVWWSSKEVLVKGYPGGMVDALTEGRLALPVYEKAALLFRDQNSLKQLITVFSRPTGQVNTAVAREGFTHTVIRH